MLKELRKAAPLLADSDPPVRVVLVDLRVPSEIGNPASRRGTKKRAGSSSYGAGVEPADASTRAFMTEVGGAPLGDAPELRSAPSALSSFFCFSSCVSFVPILVFPRLLVLTLSWLYTVWSLTTTV